MEEIKQTENTVNIHTVTIPIDEYFDLRQKAEMNGFLMERIGHFQGQLEELQRRMWELEDRINRKE